MAARFQIRLDGAGIREILKSPGVEDAIAEKTEDVARGVRALGIQVEGVPGDVDLPVETSTKTTDRAHGRVTIAHAAGQAVQSKHGALTKAALEAGLEVKTR